MELALNKADGDLKWAGEVNHLIGKPYSEVELVLAHMETQDLDNEEKQRDIDNLLYYILFFRTDINLHERRTMQLLVLMFEEKRFPKVIDFESWPDLMDRINTGLTRGYYIHLVMSSMLYNGYDDLFFEFVNMFPIFDINLHSNNTLSPIQYFILEKRFDDIHWLADISYGLDLSYCWDRYVDTLKLYENAENDDNFMEAEHPYKEIALENNSDKITSLVYLLMIYLHGVSYKVMQTTRNIIYDITIKTIAYGPIEAIVNKVKNHIPNVYIAFDVIETEVHILNTDKTYHDNEDFSNFDFLNSIFTALENYAVQININNHELMDELRKIANSLQTTFQEKCPDDTELLNNIESVKNKDDLKTYLECYRNLLSCYTKYDLEDIKGDLQTLLRDIIVGTT